MINVKINPDAIYGSVLISKIINKIMLDGKKVVAEKIFYTAIKNLSEGLKSGKYEFKSDLITKDDALDNVKLIEYIISRISPSVEVKSKRVGGSNYQIPIPVAPKRALSLAILWLANAVRSRNEKTSSERLEKEFVDILSGRGAAIKKRTDVEKTAEANKAFAYFLKRF